jgi:hypothetical protein
MLDEVGIFTLGPAGVRDLLGVDFGAGLAATFGLGFGFGFLGRRRLSGGPTSGTSVSRSPPTAASLAVVPSAGQSLR